MFISKINRAWLYKGLNDSHPQPNSDLAQLGEQETDDLEVVSSNPGGGEIFDEIYFILCNFTSDRNASDWAIVKNLNGWWNISYIPWRNFGIHFTSVEHPRQ